MARAGMHVARLGLLLWRNPEATFKTVENFDKNMEYTL